MKHLRDNNETYLSHLRFACRLGFHCIVAGVGFLIHGILPFVPPIPKHNLMMHRVRVNEAWLHSVQRILRKNMGSDV